MNRLATFTENELRIYLPQAVAFYEEYGRTPYRLSEDPYEAKLGEALTFYKIAHEKEN